MKEVTYYTDENGVEIKKVGKNKHRKLKCEECGKERWVRLSLNPLMCHSCNVRQPKPKKEGLVRHTHRLYGILNCMKQRCHNPNYDKYHNYGGRGIYVCQEWREDFMNFYNWSIDNGYKEGLEIDRIDNDGPYSPDNCRWVTTKENTRNRRYKRILTAFGESKMFVEWLEDPRCVVGAGTLYSRLKLNWDVERALTEPSHHRLFSAFGESKKIAEWYRDERCNVGISLLYKRISDGWDIEMAILEPSSRTRKESQ